MLTPGTAIGKYQEEALQYMRKHNAAAIFLPMGTGKSWVVIEWIKEKLREVRKTEDTSFLPILILAPKSVCNTWVQEFKKFGPDVYIIELHTGSSSDRKSSVEFLIDGGAEVGIANYEYAKELPNVFNTIICDESTRIKNPKAVRSQATYRLGSRSKYRYILTGSPIPKGVEDIYGQIYFLDRGEALGDNYYKFLNRYFSPIPLPGGRRFWTISKESAQRVRRKIDPYVYYKKRSDCISLPRKVHTQRYCTKTVKAVEMEEEIKSLWSTCNVETGSALAVDFWLRILALGFNREWARIDSEKYKTLVETVEDIGKEQIVVWTNFRAENTRVAEVLRSVGKNVVMVTGEVNQNERNTRLARIRDREADIIVINEQAGAFGLNELADIDYVIYFSNNYDLELRNQSEDRTYRAGRTRTVTYIDLITEGSIEEHIYDILETKECTSATFFRQEVMRRMGYVRPNGVDSKSKLGDC